MWPFSNKSVKLFYYNPKDISNFGDQLNVSIIGRISGKKVIEANSNDATHVCIGSLLEQFLCCDNEQIKNKSPLVVWGTGFIAAPGEHPSSSINGANRFNRKLLVKAVRGRLSRERLEAMGINVSKTFLGDPGLLSSKLIGDIIKLKTYRAGIMPHYVDKNDEILKDLLKKIQGSVLLNINSNPVELLEEMSKCEVILSSAMHGLIASDSLGIPNIRIKISNNLTGGDYKFEDYYSVYNLRHEFLSRSQLLDFGDNDVGYVIKNYKINQSDVESLRCGLMDSFPWKIIK